MISIIVCSRSKNVDTKLAKNIAETIGDVTYEIVWIDNSENTFNIFSAYNEGVNRAVYELLLFIHEDIEFLTEDWGQRLVNCFSDSRVGLAGVVGSEVLTRSMVYWNCSPVCYLQGQYRAFSLYPVWGDRPFRDVVAVDGMLMAIRKSHFTNGILRWDDETFNGFHFYDMDMSMQVHTSGLRIAVADILLRHDSQPNYNDVFYNNRLIFYRKWRRYMPAFSRPLSEKEVNDRQMKASFEARKMYNASLQRIEKTSRLLLKLYFACYKRAYLFLFKHPWLLRCVFKLKGNI